MLNYKLSVGKLALSCISSRAQNAKILKKKVNFVYQNIFLTLLYISETYNKFSE